MKILYIGECWLGSCARSFKEALLRHPDIDLDEVNEGIMPPVKRRWLRGVNRLLITAYKRELYEQIISRVKVNNPNIVMVYKGYMMDDSFIRQLQKMGCKVINVYPDGSPHAYGVRHKTAVGVYDLVISTKPFHPPLWQEVYGYRNTCVFVPQGYDPMLHLEVNRPKKSVFDITLVATWRPEYGDLLKKIGQLLHGKGITVGIGGTGWQERHNDFPAHWVLAGELQGKSYVDWLRRGKICLAPLNRNVIIDGVQQPGDEDTTRTYELAASNCFFIHHRTNFVRTLYDEKTEVPMYDSPEELVEKIIYYLPLAEKRDQMAKAAHARAVPAYSCDRRAYDVVAVLSSILTNNDPKE